MKILILCTGNTCRSQMAEAFLQSLDAEIKVFSAGTKHGKEVHPFAIKVMAEKGFDLRKNQPKSIDRFLDKTFDFVITVCDDAKETCPLFTGEVLHRLHRGFKDPAGAIGTDEEKLKIFRQIRDEIFSEFRNFYRTKIKK